MDFEFELPIQKEDLLKSRSNNGYVVEEIIPIRLLNQKVPGEKDCKSRLRSKGPKSLLKDFDVYFSVIYNARNVDCNLKEDVFELAVKCGKAECDQLVPYLDSDNMDPDTSRMHLNIVKMTCYVICQLTDYFEHEFNSAPAQLTAKGRKKSAKTSEAPGAEHWSASREEGLRTLLGLAQLNLAKLWNPPIADDEFVNLLANTCYMLLENQQVNRDKEARDAIFQLIGTLVKKYNHGLSCSLKMLQLMQNHENLALPLAAAVDLFVRRFDTRNIVGEILREIGRLDPQDLARDASGTRNYATFMLELAALNPESVIGCVCVLLPLLDGESYSMRNSVLGVLAEMVVRLLSGNNLSEKERHNRDQFFDRLEDHVHDVNAFVRSKVLHLWLTIVTSKALPLTRWASVLELTVGRLHDKSCSVRKNAIQLISAMIAHNPFGSQLTSDDLKDTVKQAEEKLEAMRPKQDEQTEMLKTQIASRWKELEKPVKKELKRQLERDEDEDDDMDTEDGEDQSDKIQENEEFENVKLRMIEAAKENDVRLLVKLFLLARASYLTEKMLHPSRSGDTEDDDEEDDSVEDKVRSGVGLVREIFLEKSLSVQLATVLAEAEKDGPAEDLDRATQEFNKQEAVVHFLKDAAQFVSLLQKAIPLICNLLGSKTNTDVLEAVDFFRTSFEFGLNNAMSGVRRMLVLIWSKEDSVRSKVVDAYKKLYVSYGSDSGKTGVVAVCNNLIALTTGATMGDLKSLEELVCRLVKSGDIDNKVIQTLWEKFTLKSGSTSDESKGALLLLGMVAGAKPEIVRANLDTLIREGLGPRAAGDHGLVKDTCVAFAKLAIKTKQVGEVLDEPFRLEEEHQIFTRLTEILLETCEDLTSRVWPLMAEEAINVIYKLAEHPDRIAARIIRAIAKKVLEQKEVAEDIEAEKRDENMEDNEKDADKDDDAPVNGMEPTPEVAEEGQQVSQQAAPPTKELKCYAALLSRLLYIAGHIALRQLVHLDVFVLGELKRRNQIKEDAQNNKSKRAGDKRVDRSAKKAKGKEASETLDMSIEEEMGLTGAVADDAEAEFIRRLTEVGLVTGEENLLAKLRPLIVHVCSQQQRYSDASLRAAASLALAKFMLISTTFCEQHLQILFTILEKSPEAVIRANTIVALGDLTFRFPNLIEPWTPNLYSRLRDPCPSVRKNTMMVLTHLILNDMVKVKGQISELAACVVDDDERIQGLAKLFFSELAKKGNSVYNIMPDVISRLSDPDVGVEEENFRTIMRYLFSFIQKEKHCESLVEKLCLRFRATRSERQWRDLAFCLSLLTYGEKSVRKLHENVACFMDKLGEEDVYQSFLTILNKAKGNIKVDAKDALDEFETKLAEYHDKGVDENEVALKAAKATQAKRNKRSPRGKRLTPNKATPANTPTKRRITRSKLASEAPPGVIDTEEEDLPKRPRPKRGKPPKPLFTSDDEDDDLDEVICRPQPKRGAKSKALSDDVENSDPNVLDSEDSPVVKAPPVRRGRKPINQKRISSDSLEESPPRRNRRR